MSDTAVTPPAVTDRPFGWRFTTPLFVGSALNPINSSLIATALVPIAAGVHVSVGQTAALVSALYLASAIAQPTAGKAAEVFGPRRVFLAGILLVLTGGLVGGFAPGLLILLLSRVLIGLGTSCAYPTAMVLVRRRARAVGLDAPPGGVLGGLQIAGVATASVGLPLGGVLVQFFGWRSVFFVNVPVALLALAATLLWVPADLPSADRRGAKEIAARLDVIGIAGFAAAMISLLLFLTGLPGVNWAMLAVTVVLWIAEVVWELRARTPFFDVRLLAGQLALTRTYLRNGLISLSAYVVFYGITQWLEAARGLSELDTGLLLLPMMAVSGVVIVPISRRNLIRGPLRWAALASVAAAISALFLPTGAWLPLTFAITVLLGFGMGAAAASNQLALYDQADPETLGTASGLMRSFIYLGSIASSAITGIVYRAHVTDSGVVTIAWIMTGVSVVLLLITVLDRTLARRTR